MIIVEFCLENGFAPCGSEFTRIYRNRKTARGLDNLKFAGSRNDITHYNIYSYTNIYDRNTYKFIKKVNLK